MIITITSLYKYTQQITINYNSFDVFAMQHSYVYIMGNNARNILYIGVTSDLQIRVCQHKLGQGSAFTRKYNCKTLLYFEIYGNIRDAIAREKQLKTWKRQWKDELIEKNNPDYRDLSENW